jgi:predicted nucleic acid-binding protein
VKIAGSPVYLDTSALAKLYIEEPESEDIERALTGRRDLLASDLGLTEVTSALARRVRDGEIDEAAARRVYRRLQLDVRDGIFRVLDLTAETHRSAERLLLTVGRNSPLRAADALHLAIALSAGATVLITYDQKLTAAARALGTLELPVSPDV